MLYFAIRQVGKAVSVLTFLAVFMGVALAEEGFILRPLNDGSDCRIVYPTNSAAPVFQWTRKTNVTKIIGISPTKKCPKVALVNGKEFPLTAFTSYRIDGYIFHAIRPDFKFIFYKTYGSNYRFQAVNLNRK